MARQDEYRRSGVDYEVLDEVKRAAIALAAATAPLMGAVGGTEASESPLFRSSSDRPVHRKLAEAARRGKELQVIVVVHRGSVEQVAHAGEEVISYTLNVAPSSLDSAEARAREELPADARVLWTRTVAGSCSQEQFESAALAAVLGDGQVNVEFDNNRGASSSLLITQTSPGSRTPTSSGSSRFSIRPLGSGLHAWTAGHNGRCRTSHPTGRSSVHVCSDRSGLAPVEVPARLSHGKVPPLRGSPR